MASDGLLDDGFGSSVSIDGDYAAVGSPMHDWTGNRANAGAVYVLYKGASNNWLQIADQHASDYRAQDNYGTSVSLSSSTLLVGAPSHKVGTKPKAGTVYVLSQDEGGADAWGESDILIADDFISNAQFGISVSLDGDAAAIGAHFDNTTGFHFGSAYLFDGSNGWIQLEKLTDDVNNTTDNFGYSVGISGTTIIVGSWKDDVLSALDQGSVSFFEDCANLIGSQPAEDRAEEVTPQPAKAGKVSCFPNPATDIINIDVTLPQEEAVRITVSDATDGEAETIFDGKADTESRFQWDAGT